MCWNLQCPTFLLHAWQDQAREAHGAHEVDLHSPRRNTEIIEATALVIITVGDTKSVPAAVNQC